MSLADSIAELEKTLVRNGGSAAGFCELAALKLAGDDIDGAIGAYSKCLTFDSQNAALYNNFGAVLIKAGRFEDAMAMLTAALALRPGYQRALVNLGKALREMGRLSESLVRLREALSIDRDYVPALINLGDVLTACGDLDGAQQALERAVRVAPTQAEAHMSLGISRLQAGRIADALDSLRTAVALAPGHADAHSNLAHALFSSGDWQSSWPHFEYRFRRHAYRARLLAPAGLLRWDGSLSRDLELWLIAEQGLGDQLQFARYAKLLGLRGVRCVLACDPRLERLLAPADLGARIVPFETGAESPAARWFPLMSLPQWHRTRPDTVPFPAGYLAADASRVARWRTRLPRSQCLRVGLAWAGNPRMETGRYIGRSVPLAAIAPLLRVSNVNLISLQKGAGEEQLDAQPVGASILRLPDLDAGPDAFLDTAAVLKCIDLLITSDTAIAHLAGALGVTTWLCLMHAPDWRWALRGAATPWYSSMRLFRQQTTGDWVGVYREVADALALLAARRSAG